MSQYHANLQRQPSVVPRMQREVQQVDRGVRDGVPQQRLVCDQHDGHTDTGQQLLEDKQTEMWRDSTASTPAVQTPLFDAKGGDRDDAANRQGIGEKVEGGRQK